MSKYIKLEDTIERRNELFHCYEVEEWLKSLPTIEIVYCKDCRYAQDDIFHLFCELKCHKVMMDDYCSDGERKE